VDVISINDLSHPLLSDYRGLTDVALRSVREPTEGLYIAESIKILDRALSAGHHPRSILTIPGWLPNLHELAALHPQLLADTPVFVAQDDLVESLTGFRVHRGTLASMHRPILPTLEKVIAGARRLVVLEDIIDHTNVGAIFRSVAGIGADGVIVSPSCADPLYRRSIRVSMGTVFQIPWTRAQSWDELVGALQSHGVTIVALALNPEAIGLDDYTAVAEEKIALVFGTEGDGLSPRALASADRVVSIPMRGGVDSLNVAAASAVALWALRTE
jgi:tRNA G18 (ribose-2'-O)-methylase SpoU